MVEAKAAPSEGSSRDFVLTIGGRRESATEQLEVINPATESVFAYCPDASQQQLDAAVQAAAAAFPSWSRTPFDRRHRLLGAMSQTVLAHTDELAELLTREQGKPLRDARAEIERAAMYFERLGGIEVPEQLLADDKNRRVLLRYRPLGVVGAITPWNFPFILATAKVVSALVTGNTLVLKPSPFTPLTTLRLGELALDVLPPGVLNVLAGGDDLGRWMTEHSGIAKVSFTGSVPTGKHVMASAAASLKRVTLELGGNDPAIVLADVDPDAVAERLFWGAFMNSGQVCMAIKRLYVHDDIYEPLGARLGELAAGMTVGDGLDPATDLGPVQNQPQFERVVGILNDTRAQGGRFLAGGDVPDRAGYFIAPTVVADLSDGCRVVDEEPFGPILPLIRFSDLDDAIRRANHTTFGLSGSVWSNDLELAADAAGQLEVGTAWVNQHAAIDPTVPFGGAKESGLGREYSRFGLAGYMEPQVINLAKASIGGSTQARRAPG